MTRALGIALALAATLAVVVVGFLVYDQRTVARRREPPPAERTAPVSQQLLVLAGETADRAILLKERYLDPEQAAFTDRTLAERLGASPSDWRFVEIWVVNKGAGEIRSLAAEPKAAARDGTPVAFSPLRKLLGAAAGACGELWAKDLAPDSGQPLGKGAFRRTVYALGRSVQLRDLASAEIDGVPLGPRETTVRALEAFRERPRPDMLAALEKAEETR